VFDVFLLKKLLKTKKKSRPSNCLTGQFLPVLFQFTRFVGATVLGTKPDRIPIQFPVEPVRLAGLVWF
jgi:hypothetical protein